MLQIVDQQRGGLFAHASRVQELRDETRRDGRSLRWLARRIDIARHWKQVHPYQPD